MLVLPLGSLGFLHVAMTASARAAHRMPNSVFAFSAVQPSAKYSASWQEQPNARHCSELGWGGAQLQFGTIPAHLAQALPFSLGPCPW
eukprot:14402777-Alexandrium_andersonii.AAC.1